MTQLELPLSLYGNPSLMRKRSIITTWITASEEAKIGYNMIPLAKRKIVIHDALPYENYDQNC